MKLIIFDWDGTLADSIGKIIQCKRFLALKYRLSLPNDEIVKSVLGTQFEFAMSKCFPMASGELLNQLGKDFHALMQLPKYQAELFFGAREMLQSLKEKGFKLAIATSKSRKEMENALVYNKLSTDAFELICCGDEHLGKPDPAMLFFIMKKLNEKPENCLMIGDTTTDIVFAKNAGIKVVGVTFGAHSHNKMHSVEPDALIAEWKNLSKIIEDLSYC